MLTEWIHDLPLKVLQVGGLYGAGALMALESMIAPVPSEVVMPPLGMAVHQGQYSVEAALMATSAGSLVGSLISYWLGAVGGKPLVMKVGKWLLLNEHHLDMTTAWFKRWGGVTVFVSRFVPVVRHFVSIPAGTARMSLWKFALYTVAGATLWNGFLLWVGWKMEGNWKTVLEYRKPLDAVIVVLLVVGIGAWYALHLRKPRGVATDAKG